MQRIVFPDEIAKRPLPKFYQKATAFLTATAHDEKSGLFENIKERIVGAEPVEAHYKSLKAEVEVLGNLILPGERDREKAEPSRSLKQELKEAEEKFNIASTLSNQLPLEFEKEKDKLIQAEARIVTDITTEQQAIQVANGEAIAKLGIQEAKLRADIDTLGRRRDELKENLHCQCCLPCNCCNEKALQEITSITAQIDAKSKEQKDLLASMDKPAEQKSDKLAQLNTELQAERKAITDYDEAYPAKQKAAAEGLASAQAALDAVQLNVRSYEDAFNGSVSNEMMLRAVRVREHFKRLSDAVDTAVATHGSNHKQLTDMQTFVAAYQPIIDDRLELLWCSRGNDQNGKQVYERFKGLEQKQKDQLLSGPVVPSTIATLIPDKIGIKYSLLKKHQWHVQFKPRVKLVRHDASADHPMPTFHT